MKCLFTRWVRVSTKRKQRTLLQLRYHLASVKLFWTSTVPFIQTLFLPLLSIQSHGGLEPFTAVIEPEAWYTQDMSMMHHWADTYWQKTIDTHSLTPIGNLEWPINLMKQRPQRWSTHVQRKHLNYVLNTRLHEYHLPLKNHLKPKEG